MLHISKQPHINSRFAGRDLTLKRYPCCRQDREDAQYAMLYNVGITDVVSALYAEILLLQAVGVVYELTATNHIDGREPPWEKEPWVPAYVIPAGNLPNGYGYGLGKQWVYPSTYLCVYYIISFVISGVYLLNTTVN